MSNTAKQVEQACDSVDGPCSAIDTLLTPRERDLGGFSVRRLLPTARRKMVGPWIFFDEMGPADFPAGEGINVRPHPHIGIATVTYLFEGEILHRDSVGSYQPIRPGDINLMVTGSGMTHSERERPEITATDHRIHALQLWLALPDEHEEIGPAFFHYPEADIPRVNVDGVPVRVMMGSAYGQLSPVKQHSDTLYVEAELEAGQTLTLPDAQERALYLTRGQVTVEGATVAAHTMAILTPRTGVTVTADEETRLVVIGGSPVGKRFIEWNFVSSRKERIEQAKSDWQAGRFAKVLGDEAEFIPLP